MSVYPLVAALLGPLAVAGDRLDAVRALGLVAAFIGAATVLLGEGRYGGGSRWSRSATGSSS